MRIVGTQNRSEIEMDPQQAYRRGRALDAMLRGVAPLVARGVMRGVMRGTHADFNRLDDERRARIAQALNAL